MISSETILKKSNLTLKKFPIWKPSYKIKWMTYKKWNLCSKNTHLGAQNWSKSSKKWNKKWTIGNKPPKNFLPKTIVYKKTFWSSQKTKWPNLGKLLKKSRKLKNWKNGGWRRWRRRFAPSVRIRWRRALLLWRRIWSAKHMSRRYVIWSKWCSCWTNSWHILRSDKLS